MEISGNMETLTEVWKKTSITEVAEIYENAWLNSNQLSSFNQLSGYGFSFFVDFCKFLYFPSVITGSVSIYQILFLI